LGISISIALLLRQVYLLFLPFLFAWIWAARIRRGRGLPIASMVITITLMALFILPVTVYNYSRFGRVVLLNTNSGYAFFWGNHPIYGTRFVSILPTQTYQNMIPVEVRHFNEADLDRELFRRGIQFVIEDPKRYLLLSLSRIPPYFMFWYSADSSSLSNISRIASFGVMLPFMVYGLVLAVKKIIESDQGFLDRVTSPHALLILFMVAYSGIHILTWTLIR
jgi:hypothetical protein